MLNKFFYKLEEFAPTKWRWIFSHDGFRRYFANTGWMFIGQLFSLLVAFFVGAWIARYLGPEKYGILNYAIAFAGLFSFLAALGIDGILTRELINQPEKRNELLGTAWRLKLAGGLLALLCASAAALIVEKEALVRLLVFLFSFSFIFQSGGVIQLFFQAEVKAKRNIKVQIITSSISAVLKIILILSGLGLVFLVIIYSLEALILTIGLFRSYRNYGLRAAAWKFNPILARQLWRNSWPLMLSGAAVLLFMRIDQVMIGQILGDIEVGFYAAGVKIAELWYFFPIIICSSLFPAIINAKKIGGINYNRRLRHLYYLLGFSAVVLAIPVSYLAGPIIFWLFGSSYAPAVSVLQIYVWSSVGGFLGIGLGQYLLAENLNVTNLLATFGAAVLNIVLNCFWIRSWGINGAALATLVSYFFVPVFLFIFLAFRKNKYEPLKT